MNATSPKSSFAKLGLHSKHKPLRIMVLGQSGVGKTAMIVRFITRRFIGEYDPNLEKIYSYNTIVDKEIMYFEILDVAGQPFEHENISLEANIRWADAFIIVYSITDKCSFDECNRLKFLINYNKRRRKLGGSNNKESFLEIPVILVGNKNDQCADRMVPIDEGHRRSREIACACFHEISVRESADQVFAVFRDVCRFWRVFTKFPKLKRSTSDVQTGSEIVISPDTICPFLESNVKIEKRQSILILDHCLTPEETQHDESDGVESSGSSTSADHLSSRPFRNRASTDGTLLPRPRRWRYPPPGSVLSHPERRMSISMRGSNASY